MWCGHFQRQEWVYYVTASWVTAGGGERVGGIVAGVVVLLHRATKQTEENT